MNESYAQIDLLPPPPVNKGGRPQSLPAVTMEVIKELVAQGVPYERIAERFKITKDLIYLWVCRYGWVTPAKIEKRIKELNSQVSQSEHTTEEKNTSLSTSQESALDIAAEIARKQGLGAMHGFVSRAAPVFSKFTPDVPETIGEASILLKMIKSAAGLEASQTQQTNVQVNVSTGPWGKASANGQSFRAMEVETEE
jgi:transposase